jgi:hypothetical protein
VQIYKKNYTPETFDISDKLIPENFEAEDNPNILFPYPLTTDGAKAN